MRVKVWVVQVETDTNQWITIATASDFELAKQAAAEHAFSFDDDEFSPEDWEIDRHGYWSNSLYRLLDQIEFYQ